MGYQNVSLGRQTDYRSGRDKIDINSTILGSCIYYLVAKSAHLSAKVTLPCYLNGLYNWIFLFTRWFEKNNLNYGFFHLGLNLNEKNRTENSDKR